MDTFPMIIRTVSAFNTLLVLSIACLLNCSPYVLCCVSADRPNVVLLMGDDHGWEETGYHGHPHVRTPVLDEMAASGLRWENFYAAHPSCSPTRASFLTGRHPNRMGTFAPGWSIRPEEVTVAQLMSQAGYRCGHFGKWHVGPVKATSPTNPGAMGFQQWLSHDNFFELDPSLSRNGGEPEVLHGESSQIVVDAAMTFIEETHGLKLPFFVVVWFGSPHEPYSGYPSDLALYDDLPNRYQDKQVRLTSNETGQPVMRSQGEVLRERYAEISAMDRAIGSLRQFLGDQQLRDNTLLFYCGDNGTSADGSLVTPHRGVKGQVYEGGVLVPGLMEWPQRIRQPRTTDVRASTSDLLPTLCALIGQPLPSRPLDGIDLTPIIDQRMIERLQPLYFWEFNVAGLELSQLTPYIEPELQTGTTPLVKKMGNKATRDFRNFRFTTTSESNYLGPRAIIDGDFKLVVHDLPSARNVDPSSRQTRFELFNLRQDPAETVDLYDQIPEKGDALHNALRKWQQSVLLSLTGADYPSQ